MCYVWEYGNTSTSRALGGSRESVAVAVSVAARNALPLAIEWQTVAPTFYR